jgi:ribonuclease P/MRP protein subunit POP5
MRTLPKHLRPRRRYLGVTIESWPDARIDRRAFQGTLWESARTLLGDAGSADCDPTVVRFRFEDGCGEAIVKVRREHREQGRAALACVRRIDGHPVGLRVWATSGTIRGCVAQRPTGKGSADERENGADHPLRREANVRFEGGGRRAVHKPGDRLDIDGEEGWVGATVADAGIETSDSVETEE